MKKFFLTTIAAFLMLGTFAQLSTPSKEPMEKYKPGPPEFMGIAVEGSKADIIKQYKAKGFSVVEDDGAFLKMTGDMGLTKLELTFGFTPTTMQAWKLIVYLPEQSSWYNLKTNFNEYKELLTEKYGEPRKTYDSFSSPYKEGDGYEMTGVAVGKCNYAVFWENISLLVSKLKCVIISYENLENSKLNDEEKKSIRSKAF